MIILIVIVYIIGSIFSFGKMTAVELEIFEKYADEIQIDVSSASKWYNDEMILFIVIIGSWLSFFSIMFLYKEKKYFLKFSYDK